jgi:hypothetical protein
LGVLFQNGEYPLLTISIPTLKRVVIAKIMEVM